MNIDFRIPGTVLILAVLTAAGCGGSRESGDTVSPPPPPPPSGGIIRTGVVEDSGMNTGFASIVVNGTTYDTTAAVFARDGQSATQDEFSIGETVIVKGAIGDHTNAVAERVILDEVVKGPVSAVAGSNFTVMGQTVVAGAGTLVGDSCTASLADLSSLAGEFAVEVFGFAEPAGTVAATRIECRTAADFVNDEFEVNGIVSNHDAHAMTFMINELKVDYSNALSVDGFPGGRITNGDPIQVEGNPANHEHEAASPGLVASQVAYVALRARQLELKME
jgi:hypothetical protein